MIQIMALLGLILGVQRAEGFAAENAVRAKKVQRVYTSYNDVSLLTDTKVDLQSYLTFVAQDKRYKDRYSLPLDRVGLRETLSVYLYERMNITGF